ncbi:hypothetical protein BGZ52_002741 [Haplosporangium bisporale]|nr:hypothetical protein BGZ52_002741 [Haplosporangium bisporale]
MKDFEEVIPPLALPQFPPASISLPSVYPPGVMNIPNRDSQYDPPIKPPQLTDEEFNQTWLGVPGTIKIGVLLPFTDPDRGYRTILSRISLSVLRMAVEDMNNNHVIPGLNLSLVVRDSQRPISGTNSTGGAAAISATTRLLALEVGAAIGDIASELTQAEALMTSSLGVPQCSFASYNNDITHLKNFPYLFRSAPGVLMFYDALAAVIDHYGWKRISVVYTSDVPGLLGEKQFTTICEGKQIDIKKVLIPITDSDDDFIGNVLRALKTVKYSDTRVHVLVVARPNMMQILSMARPLFCVLELFGTSMTLSWIYLQVDAPTDGVCRTGLMLISVGLTINLSALVVKNYRIYRIFNSASVINHAVSNKYLVRVVTFPVIITLIPSILHAFVHYLEPTLIRTSNGQVWVLCSSDYPQYLWSIFIALTPVLLNVFGIYLAFMTRNVTRLWNEARAITATIYLVSFFIVIIIIVKTFPTAQYPATYYVTMVCVYVACLLEYLILFYSKLRNLFLQKRGLYVPAGRDEALMDSILGGVMAGNRRNPCVSSADILNGEKDVQEGGAGDIMVGPDFEDSRRGSASSNDMHNPNISDLISSYPFGQINSDYSVASITSPFHVPTVYGQSSSMNRGRRLGSADQGTTMEHLDLSEPQGYGTRATQLILGSKGLAHPSTPMKRHGSDTVSQGQRIGGRVKDAQPYDLHEVLLVASNNRRSEGMRTADAGGNPRPGLSSSFVGMDLSYGDSAMSSSASEYGGRSRENSADYGGIGLGRGNRLMLHSRSPKVNPLQLNTEHPLHSSFMSGRRSIRETRMDSYTVTVPVQRQRWYILRVLAQWRMSKIIFVPYSKVLVIIDLETEKSSSLIVHSIEQGYSEELTHRLAEKRRQSVLDAAVMPKPKKTRVVSVAKNDPVVKTESSDTAEAVSAAPTVPASTAQPSAGVNGLSEIVVSGLHPAIFQVSPPALDPNTSSAPPPTEPVLSNNADDVEILAPRANFANSRTNSNQTITPTNPPTSDNGPRSSMRRLSTMPIINNVRKMSLSFDMDMRNMDGVLAPPVLNDMDSDSEMAVESDYIIRIISIHNECWRIQLPDKETMDRWIEIGRQIKDENWITTSRPPPQSGAKSIANSRRPNGEETLSAVPGSGSSGEWTSVGDGQRTPGLPPLRTRSSSRLLHPLQTPDDADLEASPADSIEVHGYPQRDYSDITNSSRSTNDTEERQKGRERAAKMNQKLRETSRTNKLFKSLQPSDDDPALTSAPVREVVSDSTSASSQQPASKLYVDTKISPTFGSTPIRKQHQASSLEDEMEGTELDEFDASVNDPTKERRHCESEHVNLKDILAETRVAYTDDQHAIYDTKNRPGFEHRRYRFFGSLQYNYDDKNRFRRKGINEVDKEFPESPEWHLTSSDLPDLELKHGLTFGGNSHFEGRHHSVGVSPVHDTVQFGDLILVPTLFVTKPESSDSDQLVPLETEKSKEPDSPAIARLPPLFPKFETGRKDSYQDTNTIETDASPVQAQPSPDVDLELLRAIGQAKSSHWVGDNGGGVGGASDVVDGPLERE